MAGCPSCGAELAYVGEYDRHYCYDCRSYAPRSIRPCAACGRALVFVREHQRFYCYGCETYEDAEVERPCPNCGEELEYDSQNDRHRCPACGESAPSRGAPTPPRARGPTMSPEEDEVIGYAPFSREEMDLASKEMLMEWCRDYDLDDSGLKYELRLRLLEHIRRNGLLLKGEIPTADAEGEESGGPEASEAAVVVEEAPPPAEPDVGALLEGVGSAREIYDTPPGEAFCPTCGQSLTYVSEYDQWYCYHCQSYTREPVGSAERGEAARVRGGRKGRGGLAAAGLGLVLFLADQLFFHAPSFIALPITLPEFLMTPEVDWGLGVLSIVLIVAGLMAAVRRR